MPGVATASPAQLDEAVHAAYLALASAISPGLHHHPVRFWNYVPRLLDAVETDRNRYMVFNAARHRALEAWLKTSDIQPRLVAASAVDAQGDDLIVHALSGRSPATPIENPRQRPAYRYSAIYGPVPPSFARGTVVTTDTPFGSPLLITAGTASVVGEETRHPDNLSEQLRETERNLIALITETTSVLRQGARPFNGTSATPNLDCFRHVRAYFSQPEGQTLLEAQLPGMFPRAERIELVPAVLCRPGLVVEIEGIAVL